MRFHEPQRGWKLPEESTNGWSPVTNLVAQSLVVGYLLILVLLALYGLLDKIWGVGYG